jgi:site-specific DNA-methyltransferase (adenine-specific)
MGVRLEPGNCLDVIPRLVAEGVVVDAVVTDPPYDLSEIPHVSGKRMFAPRTEERRAARKGFMGKSWDGTKVAFKPETWAAVLSILRPGGYLLAFGGTRTYHRMVCAIEDAGFVIQDTVMWLYGSGWPKNRTLLKPAFEPICMAYKPGGKRALGIEECRIGTDKRDPGFANLSDVAEGRRFFGLKHRNVSDGLGRWPANVIHDGSDEVMEAFAAYGDHRSAGEYPSDGVGTGNGVTYAPIKSQGHLYDDGGSAVRFFYSAKADKQDRWGSKHPTVKPVDLIRYLVKLVTPPGGTFLDPFAGSGTAAVAALAEKRNAILIEQSEEYCADIRERIAHYEGEGRHSLAAKNRSRSDRPGTLI